MNSPVCIECGAPAPMGWLCPLHEEEYNDGHVIAQFDPARVMPPIEESAP